MEVVPLEEPEPGIVAAARRGDIDAFETLVRMYQPYVWRLCTHLLGGEHSAHDVAQEAFLKAFRSMNRFKGNSKFSTWLISIARNCVHDEVRSRSRRQRLTRAVQTEHQVQTDSHGQTAIEVRDALVRLPLELREPVVLIDMLGFSYREASKALAVREGTVKRRVHRARSDLITILEGEREDADEA